MLPNLKLYLYATYVVACFGAGWYVNSVFTGHKILELEAAYANERTQSAEAARAAEQRARETEQNWILTVNRATEAGAEDVKVRDARIRALNATNGQLRKRITDYAKALGAAEDPNTAVADLLQYIERAGALVVELDSFAGAAAVSADTLRDELALCRNYVKALQ